MATQDEQASSKEVKIASDGDVVFLVGPNRKRIQVYSTTMKMASAVFAAMLGPRFSEGQKILARSENEQPIEIKLPDDDPEAFLCICQILHWVGRKANPTSPEILNMAFLADKYDLTRPLSYAVNTWVCEDLQSTDVSTSQVLWELLVASHLFGSSQAFKQVSRKLLMAHVGSFWELAAALPGFGMGYKIACRFATCENRQIVPPTDSWLQLLTKRQGTRFDSVFRKLILSKWFAKGLIAYANPAHRNAGIT
ncbi:Fc.00g071770.m01.CDS01 [Cosmosporella sp. VM-42]